MARKMECDRCGKQWDQPKPNPHEFAVNDEDRELCIVEIRMPADSRRGGRPIINTTKELCQDCGRHIAKQLERQPKVEQG